MLHNTPIDFVVLCALSEELTALLTVFDVDRRSVERLGTLRTWSTIYHGKHIRIVDMDEEQGVLSAGVVATELLNAWGPWCVVSFGIAGRALLDPEDVDLGDVVIGTSVDYYEPGKETDREDGTPLHLGDLHSFGTDAPVFGKYFHAAAEACHPARLKPGNVMSGEKKIAGVSNIVKAIIANTKRKTLAIEMEAAGVARAVERFRRIGSVKFLVIKGLSDDAGYDETDRARAVREAPVRSDDLEIAFASRDRTERRTLAALNAAKALAAIAKATPVTLEVSQAAHLRARQVLQTASKFVYGILPLLDVSATVAALGRPVDRSDSPDLLAVAASGLIRRATSTPPVFVHWRIRRHFHPLHWLDFATMLHLRRATGGAMGVPCTILLSDNDQIEDVDRQVTERLIRQIMPADTRITWLSQARDLEPLIDAYIANMGLTTELSWLKPELAHKPESFWLRYVVWATHGIGSCFLLAWTPSFSDWNLLFKVYSRQVMILYRRTIYLDEALAKTENPGRRILITPPNYEHLAGCIESLPSAVLAELVEHLSMPDDNLISRDGTQNSMMQRHGRLVRGTNEDSAGYRLLTLMDYWNTEYFCRDT